MTAFRLGSKRGSKVGVKVLAGVLVAVLVLSLGGGRVVVGGHHSSGPSGGSGDSWLDALGRLVGLGPHGVYRPVVKPRQLPEGAVPRVDALPAAKKWPAAKRVKELPAQRTANATFYKLSDGRVQADISAAPVHYRDSAGVFRPIDTRVRPLSSDGFVAGNTTNVFGTFFGNRSDRLVRVRDGDRWVDLGLAGPVRTLTPQIAGSRVTYADAFDGADLVYDLTSTGLKEGLVLNRPVSSGFTAAFTVAGRGVQPVSNRDGSISLVSANAAPLMTIPAPYMYDSARSASSPVGKGFSNRVSQQLSGSTLTLSADAAWLADAKRQYPVIIDPSINIQPVPTDGQDVEIYSGSTGTNYNDTYQLKVGTDASQSWRSLVQFPLTGIPAGTAIDDATLSMYYDQTQYTYAYDVAMEARPITTAWSESTATWANMNANIAPVPAGNVVQVDDSDTGKVAVKGTWPASTNSTLLPLAVNSTYHYNSDTTTGDTFTWVPTITQAGNYQVEVHYVSESDRPTNAPYTVFYNGGSKTGTVDQTGSAAGVWKTLGTFPFVAGTTGKVVLGDVSGKSAIADAVRFTRSGVDTKKNAVSSVWNNFSVRDAVQSWVNTPSSNHGLMVKAVDEGTKGRGGPVYEASEYAYQNGARDYNLPKLTVTFGRPGVTVAQPSTITSTGAVLSWSSYVDPSSATGDNIVEYQVHRSVHQMFTPSAGTLVAPLSSSTTGYQDTSGRPTAADTPDSQLGQYYYYMVVVKTADGQLIPSPTVGVRLPKAGHITQVYRTGTVDTTLSKTLPTTNVDVYDGDPYVSAGNNSSLYGVTRGLVKFPTPTGIPTGAQITDAQLRMWTTYDYGATNGNVDVHKLNRAFNETGATWNQAASGTAWTTPGGDFDATPLSTVGGSTGITNDPEWESWNVTSAVKSWVTTPANNFGLLLKMHDETAATQRAMLLSSEGQEPMLRPTLEVTYLAQTAEAAYYAPDTPTVMTASSAYTIPVTVSNPTLATLGTGDWELGYQWETTDGQPVVDPTGDAKTALPASVAPGASIDINAQLKTPPPSLDGDTRTDYTLKWALHNKTTNQWMYQVTPAIQTLDQQVAVQEPTSDQLGVEKFYDYSGIDTGAGSSLVNNLHAGNTVWNYNAFSNPSRGPSTSLSMTYNSLDTSDTVSGPGWSMQAASMMRLGAPLDFHPNPNPTTVTLTDADGTSHLFSWNATANQWKSPAGVHLYLQNPVTCGPKTEEDRAWVLTRPDRTQFYFKCDGYLSSIVDNNGNTMRFSYEVRKSQNKPVEFLKYVTDAAGRPTLTIDYWAKGDTYDYVDDDTWTKVTGQSNLTNPFIIDHVKKVTDISGRTLTFTYTDKGLLGEMVDGAGSYQPKVFRFQYDMTQGNKNVKLIKAIDPLGHATNLTYYSRPEDDPEFKWWTKTYTDRLGFPTSFAYTDPDGPQGEVINTAVTDAENHTSTDVTDGFGRPTQSTNAKHQTTTLHYDADHNADRVVEDNGAVFTTTYDPKTGYPTESKDAEANKNGWPGTIYTYQTGLGGHIADLIGKQTQEGQVRPGGRLWTYGHDTAGNVVSVTDPDGNETGEFPNDYVTTYTYDAFGQVRTTTDANEHTTRYDDYSAGGQPQTIKDAKPDDPATTFTYDLRGNTLTVTDGLQHTSSYTYDVFGRPGDASRGANGFVSKIPKDQATGQFIIAPAPVFDANDNLIVSTDPNGAQTTASYDAADQMKVSLAPRDTATSPERKSTIDYDKVGNVLSVTEPNGNLTPSDPNDFVTRYTYDEIYQTATKTDGRGGLTTYGYDNVGNLTKTVDQNKNATADPDDFTNKFTYDLNHRPRTTTDAAGFTASVDYDRDGLPIVTTDEEGNKTLLSYDARGMLAESKAPHDTVGGVIDYNTTQFVYDEVGNRTRVISPRGVETPNDDLDFVLFTDYDELNRVKEQTLPYSVADPFVNEPTDTIINTYDTVGNLTKVSRPPSGSKIPGVDFSTVRVDTTYTYFDNGWMKTSTDPFGVVDSYDYDALGDQSQHVTTSNDGALTRNVGFTYYPDGKLQTKDDEGFPADFPGGDTEFHKYAYTYDANGNMTDLHDNSDIANVPEWVMTYNQVNQVATVQEIVAEGANHNATYDFYPNGTLKKRTYDSLYDSFEYDPVDQVSKVTNGDSTSVLSPDQTLYTYTPRGQVHVETRAQGSTIENTYYADGLLKHRLQKGGPFDQSTVAEHTLTYDANGNELTDQARVENADSSGFLSRDKVYTYDPRDRVATVGDGTTIEGYAYDANNNVLGEVMTNATVAGDERVFNAYDRNRLVQSTDDKTDDSSKSTFTYDTLSRLHQIDSNSTVKGNAVSGKSVYTYDGFSRKKTVQQDSGGAPTQNFVYQWDSLDRLRQAFAVADDPSQGGLTKENKVFYTYLGASNLILNEDRKELDTNGQVTDEQVTGYRYGLLGNRLSQDTKQTHSGATAEAEYNYSIDPRGNVEALTFQSGLSAATYGYTAHGHDITALYTGLDKPNDPNDPSAPPKTPVNVYRFAAQQFDPQNGTYNIGFRDYSPSVSNFLTPSIGSDPRPEMRLGPVSVQMPAPESPGIWDWLKAQGKALWNDIKNDPWQFVGELAIGAAAAIAVGLICSTGIGCVILAGIVAGAAAAAYGYGVDTLQGEHGWNTGDFLKTTAIGAAVGGVTAGIGYGIGRGISRLLGRGIADAASAGAGEAAGDVAAGSTADAADQAVSTVARGADDVGQTAATACSFGGSTDVLMADGSRKPIKDVEVGDQVVASDPETGEQAAEPVTHVFVHQDTVTDLVLDDGTVLAATDNHPFWSVTDGAFERADQLAAGEKVLTADGRVLSVRGFRHGTSRSALAYNLEVQGIHTYHVGDDGVLVHNVCRTFARLTPSGRIPNSRGVYVIQFKNGRGVYVGSATESNTIHVRLHRAFTDPKHAVQVAGLRVSDIAQIRYIEMPNASALQIHKMEQALLDSYGGWRSPLTLNRKDVL